jgi:hypothetical protein
MKKLVFALLALACAVINAYAVDLSVKKEIAKKITHPHVLKKQQHPASH